MYNQFLDEFKEVEGKKIDSMKNQIETFNSSSRFDNENSIISKMIKQLDEEIFNSGKTNKEKINSITNEVIILIK